MRESLFSLTPFPNFHSPDISITGNISIQSNILAGHYSLTGKIEQIFLPARSTNPGRKDELWKTTCFEFFLAMKGQSQYWEFNMSPSGDWNVYHMDAYRRVGFREETSIQQLPVEVRHGAGVFHLNVVLDLNPILDRGRNLEFGVAAIIQTTEGSETYWALTHPASIADFHLREGFILELAGQTHLPQQPVPGG